MICYLEELIRNNFTNLGFDKKPEKISFIYMDFSTRKRRKSGFKSIAYIFLNDNKCPSFVVKYSNVDSVKEEIKKEFNNLLTIHERGRDVFKNVVPAPLFLTDILDYKVIVQSYLSGIDCGYTCV